MGRKSTQPKAAATKPRRGPKHVDRAAEIPEIGSGAADFIAEEAVWPEDIYRMLGLDVKATEPGLDAFIAAIHSDDRAKLREFNEQARRGEKTIPIEFRVVGSEGSTRHFHCKADFQTDPEGRRTAHISTISDTVERQASDGPERRNRKQLSPVRPETKAGFSEINLNTQKETWSPDLYRFLNLDPKTTKPGSDAFAAAIHPDDRAMIQDQASIKGRRGEEIAPSEFRTVGSDGAIRWFYRSPKFIRGADGRPTKLIATVYDITERKAAADAENRSQKHLARGQQLGRLGSIEVDLRTREVYWSPEVYRLHDLDPAAIERPKPELVVNASHPDDRQAVIEFIKATESGVLPAPIENRVLLRNGGVRWVRRTAEFVTDERGVPAKLLVINQDVTERKGAEEALRRSREHLARAQRVGHIGSIEVDVRTDTSYWSEEVYRLYELDPASAGPPGLDLVLNFTHPNDRQAVVDFNTTLLSGIVPAPMENRIPLQDGTIRWIQRTAEIVSDNFGAPLTLLITNQDITERKHAEAELLRSQEHLERVQKIAKIGSTEIDLITLEEYWSDEMFQLIGLDPKAVKAEFDTFLAATHPDDRDKLRDVRAKARKGEEAAPAEFRVIWTDGTARWLYRQASLIRDAAARPVKMIATWYDISDRKAAEEVLRQSREHLALVQRIAMIGSAEFDLATQKSTWSEEINSLIGLPPEAEKCELDTFLAAIHAGDRIKLGDAIKKGQRGEETRPAEFRVVWPDGTIRWLYRQSKFLRDADGRLTKMIATMYDITDRKAAEEELHRSREHLALVQRIAGIGSSEVDLVTQEVIWSEELYRFLDLDPKTTKPGAEAFLAAIHPDDRALIRDQSARGRRGESLEPCEFRIVRSDGAIQWFYRRADFIRDAAGRRAKLVATMYDITRRKATEATLSRSREHLARVQSVARIGSIEVDLVTQEAIWSDEMFRLLGLDPQLVNPGIDAYVAAVHPKDRATVRDLSARGRRGEEVESREYRIVGKDGAIRWMYHQAVILRDAGGQPIRHIMTMYDITERKAAEEARRVSEEQYRLTFELAPIGIAHVALDGHFLLVNDTLCKILGATHDEMLATSFHNITHPDDVERSDESSRRLVSGEASIVSWQKRYICKDGRLVWCHITSMLKHDEAGHPANFISTYEDITPAKDAEARELLLEEQLLQSQKMEAVGRLTGGVAHDFNNLLTVILINLEMIGERVAGDPKLKRQVESALGAGRRGADLTQRLLAFSRRQPLAPVMTDINKRITDLAPLLTLTLGETIPVMHLLDLSLWMVVVDPGQFESAIVNLAVNARDASPNGGVLEIKTANLAVDAAYAARHPGLTVGRYVSVSVTDTGTGMSHEVVAKAFEPFFTTKEVGKGTGLGLSMIYGFIKQSGGHVSIASEVGVGTTVTMLLPASEGDRIEDIVHGAPEAGRKVGCETILVVEDDPEVRLVAVSLLEALGYRTLEAGTVREGFDIFAANADIALVLTDVILPGGEDGADLGRRVWGLRPNARILFMSGYADDIVMHNGRLDPGVILLQKPFTRNQLAEKVRVAIDSAPLARTP